MAEVDRKKAKPIHERGRNFSPNGVARCALGEHISQI